jgi:hypothetical protein
LILNRKQNASLWGLAVVFSGLLFIIVSLTANEAAGQSTQAGLDPQAYLPAIIAPPPTPEPPVSSVEALLEITPSGGINASTYNSGAFIITNASNSTARINQVVIDLRTAAFPDMVFDPFGTAGDLVAKDVTIDSNPGVVGFTGHSYSSPHDDGFDVLTLNFNNFDPGEKIFFSVDVDPTTIRGVEAPGPAESGSVSGLELSGVTVIVSFANSLVISSNALRVPGSSSGSAALIRENLPVEPVAEIENIPSTPATVASANQVVQISGAPVWSTAVVVVIEGGLFTDGLPGGGFDIDPYEANSAIKVNEFSLLVNNDGTADIPITLTRTDDDGGLNHILVYLKDYYGYSGPASETMILELTP